MKHKFFVLIAGLLMTVTASAQFSGSGDGTADSPYLISNEIQLYQMGNFLNNPNVYFKLMNDLDLTSFISENFPSEGWTPVGFNSSAPFKGHFEGNNHTVRGVWINKAATDYVGFFGYVDGAFIHHLTIEGTSIKGANLVGGFAGYTKNATIENCHVTFSDKIQGTYYVGGFVGQTQGGTINNCNVDVVVQGTTNVGGFVGMISSTNISSSKATGNVSGSTDVAGIVGYADGMQTLSELTHEGNVTGTSRVSGIAGQLASGSSTTFSACCSKGKLTNTGDYTGGIVAVSNGVAIAAMTYCGHFGDIEGQLYTGGLIGGVTGTDITNGLSDTKVYISTSSSSNTKKVSRFIFDLASTTTSSVIDKCTVVGNISGTSYTGGLVGKDEASLSCSNWTTGGSKSISCNWTESNSSSSSRSSTAYIWFGGTYRGYKSTGYVSYSSWNGISYSFNFSISFSPNISQSMLTYTNSYYSGIITGTTNVGGIAGYKRRGKIQNCYTNASIYADNLMGGLVGDAAGGDGGNLMIESNVAINSIISVTGSNIGRIYGRGDYISTGSLGNRALTTTKVIKEGVVQDITDNPQNGHVMGPVLLKMKDNYAALGWDMENIWGINEGLDYPYLRFFGTVQPVSTGHTITWKNYDDTVLEKDENPEEGTIPAYNGETPERPADVQYTYTFIGWTPEVVAVRGTAIYLATYSRTLNQYTVTFRDEDGTVLDSRKWDYGATPAYNGGTPAKPSDEQYTYTFAGWTPETVAVTGDATYTATYSRDAIQAGSYMNLQAGEALVDDGEVRHFTTLTQQVHSSSAASITACGEKLSADFLKVQVSAQTGTWLYLMFPSAISFSQITAPGQYVAYSYDGAIRAQNGADGSAWSRQNGQLAGMQGHILQVAQSGDFMFSIAHPEFPCGTQTTLLPVYPSSNPTDANWTLTGNPFPSYFSLQALHEAGFNAPVYVRSKNKDDYEAFRPQDDNYHFRPYEAFFVQNPGTTATTLQWPASGRETESQVWPNIGPYPGDFPSYYPTPARARQAEQNRRFVELSLNGGGENGHTRLVFNDEASADYELGRDAVRMNGNAPVRIYTLDAQTRYAINEQPLAGAVSIGFRVEKDGVYTLKADRMDTEVEIYDNLLNRVADLSQGGYEFFSVAGTDETRFTLRGIAQTTTGTSDLTDGNGLVSIYTPNGVLLYENVMMNDVTLLPGVYVIKSDSGVRKVVIR